MQQSQGINPSAVISAVILTALSVEYQAIRAHLSQLCEIIHPSGTIYERGIFLTSNNEPRVIILRETGKGNACAAQEAERAIDYFQPSLILFVGIAGGLKDVQLGDVVVASKIYSYDSGKASTTLELRPTLINTTYRLEQRIRAEVRKTDWLQRIGELAIERPPRAFFAPIAAGEKVIASTISSEWQFLKAYFNDAVAVETEGFGFFHTARANPEVDALAIRGISDLIDNKSETDAAHFQEIAACHASAFAFELLATIDVASPRQKKEALHDFFNPRNSTNISMQRELSLNAISKVKQLHKMFFSLQQTNLNDMYKCTIKFIIKLEIEINKYYEIKVDNIDIAFTLNIIESHLKEIKFLLKPLLRIYLLGKSEHSLLPLRKQISFKLDLLIEKLEYLKDLEYIKEEK